MLGREVAEALAEAGLSWVGTGRATSILEPPKLARFAAGKPIHWIVNCAGYTAVDRAEDEEGPCRGLNADGPENLGRLAAEIGARVLQVSTDYVFDGASDRPYLESDAVRPLNVYGRTKAEGEARLVAAAPESIIVRGAWLYGRHGPNFVATMLRLMNEREGIGVVADQRGSPTWARNLALALLAILRTPNPAAGLYHYTDEGETTWFDFALAIRREGRAAGLLSRDCRVEPLTTAQYPTKARRPAYSTLSTKKIRQTFGVAIPPWETSLRNHLAELARAI